MAWASVGYLQVSAATTFTYEPNGNVVQQGSALAGPPVILAQPRDQWAQSVGGAGFSVVISSSSPATFQWKHADGTDVPGATGDSLYFPEVSAANEGGYYVVVTNASGFVTSATALLRRDANGNSLPDDWELTYFGNLLMTATGDFDGDGISNMAEYQQGSNPASNPTAPVINYWIAESGSFTDPTKWSLNRVPTATDTAVINTGTFTLPNTGTLAAGKVVVNVPFAAPPKDTIIFRITGAWRFNSTFNLTTGHIFQVQGSGGSITVAGPANLVDAKVQVAGGATVEFPTVTDYIHPGTESVLWQASGAGSELIFPNLTRIQGCNTANYLTAEADTNGKVTFPALTTISKPADGNTSNDSGVVLRAASGGLLSAPMLVSFVDSDPTPNSQLYAGTASTVSTPQLFSATGVSIDLSQQSAPHRFTSLTNARTIRFNSGNGTVTPSNLATITGNTWLQVAGGANVAFPNLNSIASLTTVTVETAAKVNFTAVQSYTFSTALNLDVDWVVRDPGSELTFGALQTIAGPSTAGEYLTLLATESGKLNFPALTAITKATDGDNSANSGVYLHATSLGVLSAPLLSAFNDDDVAPDSEIYSGTASTVSLPALFVVKGASIDLSKQSAPHRFISLTNARTIRFNSGDGIAVTSNLATVTGTTSIEVTGGANVVFGSLSSLANLTSVNVNSASKANFTAAASYSFPATLNQSVPWTATGSGSELSFGALQSIAGPPTPGEYLRITAPNAGKVMFPALASVSKVTDGDSSANSGVIFNATDGGLISAPVLTAFNDNDVAPDSELSSGTASTVSTPQLFTAKGVSIDLSQQSAPYRFVSLVNARTIRFNSGDGSPQPSSLTTVTGNTTLQASNNANLIFSQLQSVASLTAITVDTAAKVDLRAVTSYVFPPTFNLDVGWTARNPGSELRFSALQSIVGPSTPGEILAIRAESSGIVSFPLLEVVTKPGDGDNVANSGVTMVATGSGVISAPQLYVFADKDTRPGSGLTKQSSGNLILTSLSQAGVLGVTLSGLTLPTQAPLPRTLIFSKYGNLFTLKIPGLPGKSYQLQESSNLSPASWSNVGSPQTGSHDFLSFSATSSGGRNFYRVSVTPWP